MSILATAFQQRNVRYGDGPEKPIIGKYCAPAAGTRFVMAGANHPNLGVSTFPFTIFGGDWAERTMDILTGMATG
jgi:virginiamycin A acetyltransferase